MNSRQKDILYIFLIIILTASVIFVLFLFSNYAKSQNENNLPITSKWVIVLGVVNLILIGIPAWIHKKYVNDYTPIKKIWFFALFGGITGAMLGEQGNFVMIIPYTILMLIYAFFYKKFTWWKVALTSYLGGIIIENVINRSPLQSSTLIWIALFIYPYFITKIWENRNKITIIEIIKDLKYIILFSLVLGILAAFSSRNNISPPLILFGLALPFLIKIIYDLIKKR